MNRLVQTLVARTPAAVSRRWYSASLSQCSSIYENPNFPLTSDGRVHHLDIRVGEVAPRILSVGDQGRAARIAAYLDSDANVFEHESSRGFVTHTGRFEGVPVSIIATGMGLPMIDFVVRETRPLIDGAMAYVRYGSCGGLADTPVGHACVATDGAVLVRREPDAIHHDPSAGVTPELPYSVSKPVLPDEAFTAKLLEELTGPLEEIGHGVKQGMNMTTDSFYSSQGRIIDYFRDSNDGLLEHMTTTHPSLVSCEMETFHLLDLARSSKQPIFATAAAVALANRNDTRVLTHEEFQTLERVGGEAILRALTAVPLDYVEPKEAVWNL